MREHCWFNNEKYGFRKNLLIEVHICIKFDFIQGSFSCLNKLEEMARDNNATAN